MNNSFSNYLTSLNDSFAEKVDWTPMLQGGANYQTFKMVEVSPQRIEFQLTGSDKIFTALCFLVGVGCCGGGGYLLMTGEAFSIKAALLIPLGLLFIVGGVVQITENSKTPMFDQQRGLFWKGTAPETDQQSEQRQDCAPLNQIHAIQIVKEAIGQTKTKYSSYELNLVLKDGSRVNVIDHGDRNAIRTDSTRLGEILGVPIWDSSEHTLDQ